MYKEPGNIESVTVDGEKFPVDLIQGPVEIIKLTSDGYCVFRYQHKKYQSFLDLQSYDDGKITARMKGHVFNIKINTKLSLLIEELGFNESLGNQDQFIMAPMPGLVLKTMTQPGEEVQEGQALLTLEAMKMENILKSPRDGKIREVLVSQGEKVDKGKILIEFE